MSASPLRLCAQHECEKNPSLIKESGASPTLREEEKLSPASIATAANSNNHTLLINVGLQPWRALRRVRMIAVLALPLLVFVAACTGTNEDELVVFAAASLTDVLTELGEQYGAETRTSVIFSFGGSQLLSRQIVDGAPADLMISAGRQPIDLLEREQVVEAGPFDLVSNELVVVTRSGFSDPPGEVADLASESIKNLSIPDPNLAPAGAYARESLTSLGLWEALADKIVPTGDVRASLTNAERGNTDAAIVYRTDAVSGSDLQILDIIPPDSHSPIVYPVVVTTRTKRPEAARRFAEFLVGEAAGKIFARYGFTPLFNKQVGQ